MQYGTQTIHRTKPYSKKLSRTERLSRLFTGSTGGAGSSSPKKTTTGTAAPDTDDSLPILDSYDMENPIWTIQHDSMFLINVTNKDIDNSKALTVSVWARQQPTSILNVSGWMTRRRRSSIATEQDNEEEKKDTAEEDIFSVSTASSVEIDVDTYDNEVPTPKTPVPNRQNTTMSTTSSMPPTPSSTTSYNTRRNNNNNKIIFIGKVKIPSPQILNEYCSQKQNQRIELPLVDELGRPIYQQIHKYSKEEPTLLAIRCRMASKADINFIEGLQNERNPLLSSTLRTTLPKQVRLNSEIIQEPTREQARLTTEIPETEMIGASLTSAIQAAVPAEAVFGKIKIKPTPPKGAPQFMTFQQLKDATLQPSTNWIQVSSLTPKHKKYGRFYVEILSCNNLPNVDYGGQLGNQTDTFCSIVYGDGFVQTNVIDDELSPYWLPWTQRAFVFPIGHPSQLVYVGVFGYKRHPLSHVPIGRVEINLTNLQESTEYILEYNLLATSHNYMSQPTNGQIRIRLRLEVDDGRSWLIESLKPPPPIYINTTKKKSLKVARYTAMGEYVSENTFQLSVFQGYIDEILQGHVRRILYKSQDGLRSLLLWRNQVTIFGGRIGVPLYSVLVFIMSFLAVEHPTLIPGMLLLGFTLFMLAEQQHRIHVQPAPYHRCLGFIHYAKILLLGKAQLPVFDEIPRNHRIEDIRAHIASEKERIERDRAFFGKKEAIEKAVEEIEHERIQTSTKIPIQILSVLGDVQKIVGDIVRGLRMVDAIANWEESNLSFFITLFSLFGGILLLFIPWGFLFKWGGRLVVIVFLGPVSIISDDECCVYIIASLILT